MPSSRATPLQSWHDSKVDFSMSSEYTEPVILLLCLILLSTVTRYFRLYSHYHTLDHFLPSASETNFPYRLSCDPRCECLLQSLLAAISLDSLLLATRQASNQSTIEGKGWEADRTVQYL